MNKKNTGNGILMTIIVSVVLLLILNVVTFFIPFNIIDLVAHYIVYGCAEFVILFQMILTIILFFGDEPRNQKVIGLPIVFWGIVTLISQLLFTTVFYVINSFSPLPIWVVIIVETIILGFGAIQLSKGFFFKNKNVEYHERVANTLFMDNFRARLKGIQKINSNENLDKVLLNLVDIALGSDPVSNDNTLSKEEELLSLLEELDLSIKNGLEEDSKSKIEKVKNTLIERNVLCKAGK